MIICYFCKYSYETNIHVKPGSTSRDTATNGITAVAVEKCNTVHQGTPNMYEPCDIHVLSIGKLPSATDDDSLQINAKSQSMAGLLNLADPCHIVQIWKVISMSIMKRIVSQR